MATETYGPHSLKCLLSGPYRCWSRLASGSCMVWSHSQGHHLAQLQGNYAIGMWTACSGAVQCTACSARPSQPVSLPLQAHGLLAEHLTQWRELAWQRLRGGLRLREHKVGACSAPQTGSSTTSSRCPSSGLLPAPKAPAPGLGHQFGRVPQSVLVHLFGFGIRQVIPPLCASVSSSVKGGHTAPPLWGCYED